MYQWRRLTQDQREAVLRERRLQSRAWHSPPHRISTETTLYHVTAACYEHAPILGSSPQRMSEFEVDWLGVLSAECQEIYAWALLPNHYHSLVQTTDVLALLKQLGLLHGRTSYRWNFEDMRQGRHVWCNALETAIKSERHFWSTLNDILNNPIRHGYVVRWQDWPYSNANEFLDRMGREAAVRIWDEYPVLDYGADWDPPEM